MSIHFLLNASLNLNKTQYLWNLQPGMMQFTSLARRLLGRLGFAGLLQNGSHILLFPLSPLRHSGLDFSQQASKTGMKRE